MAHFRKKNKTNFTFFLYICNNSGGGLSLEVQNAHIHILCIYGIMWQMNSFRQVKSHLHAASCIGFSHGLFYGLFTDWLLQTSIVHYSAVPFGNSAGLFLFLFNWMSDHGTRTDFVGFYFSIFSLSPAATRYTGRFLMCVFLCAEPLVAFVALYSSLSLSRSKAKYLLVNSLIDSCIIYNLFADADELQFRSWMALVGWIESAD